MSRFWRFLLGLDQAGNALLSDAGLIADETQDITISGTFAALALWRGTPDAVRERAYRWQARIDGFFLFWCGQHCHCAASAWVDLDIMRDDVADDIRPRLQAYLGAAGACGLRTRI